MKLALILTTLLALVVGANAQSLTAAAAKITASDVWQPPADFLAKAHAVCDKSAGPESFPACFINQMAAAGAPADAVNFSRMLLQQSDGQLGVMSAFKSVGPVDVAQVFYPLRANTNYGLLLVNGDPNFLDVDDFQKLDRKGMDDNPMYQAVKQKYPQTDMFAGDRSGNQPWPRVEPLPDGGKRFVVSYPLINGCRACASVGLARYGWDFDAKGKFLHAAYIPTPPPPRLTKPDRRPPQPPPSQPQATAPSQPPSQ
jgi:hypothetical protein